MVNSRDTDDKVPNYGMIIDVDMIVGDSFSCPLNVQFPVRRS